MPRPPKDGDATQNLRPPDETRRAKQGTKIGKRPKRREVAEEGFDGLRMRLAADVDALRVAVQPRVVLGEDLADPALAAE